MVNEQGARSRDYVVKSSHDVRDSGENICTLNNLLRNISVVLYAI